MNMCRAAVVAIVFLATAWTAGAQVSVLPPRDGGATPRVGTGVIRGRVIDGQTGAPLPRARVSLGGPGEQRPPVLSDDSGNFTFTGLPAGSYSLIVNKSTYLIGTYPKSGDSLRSSDSTFPVLEGQRLDRVTVSLFRGGVISGRVVDSHGEPIELAHVQVMRLARSGSGSPTVRGGGATNDLGEFRVAGLEPGRYVLLVQPRQILQDGSQTAHPIPTFYPGVSMREQAVPIIVQLGTVMAGLEVTLVEGTMSRVTGTVLDPSGRLPISGLVTVRGIIGDMPGGVDTAVTQVKADGGFELTLAPGDYQMEARTRRPGTVSPLQPGDEQFGTTRLSVSGEPISDVTILVGGGARVSGRVVFEGSTALPPSSLNAGQFRVTFSSAPGGAGCRVGRSELAANWTFSVDGLLGSCVARVEGSLGQLTVKGIMVNEVDLLDRPVIFESGQQLRNVEVIVTNKRTDVTFQVADEHGQPTRDYVALVFSVDKAHWVQNSRYIRAFVPTPSPLDPAWDVTKSGGPPGAGAFAGAPTGGRPGGDSVDGLPQGDYYVVALDDLDSEAVEDPVLLEDLSRAATRIKLTDAAAAEVQLRRMKFADPGAAR